LNAYGVIGDGRYLQQQNDRNADIEFFMLRLMMEQPHSTQCSDASAYEGKKKQRGFGNTPLAMLGLPLVQAEHHQCYRVYDQHITDDHLFYQTHSSIVFNVKTYRTESVASGKSRQPSTSSSIRLPIRVVLHPFRSCHACRLFHGILRQMDFFSQRGCRTLGTCKDSALRLNVTKISRRQEKNHMEWGEGVGMKINCLKMSKTASRKTLFAYDEAFAIGNDFASFLPGRLV